MRDDAPHATRWGVASLVLVVPASVLDVLITTDIPLVYFSVASALVFLHVPCAARAAWAVRAERACCLARAFLSKYFAVLLGLAYVGWALWRPAVWKWKALGAGRAVRAAGGALQRLVEQSALLVERDVQRVQSPWQRARLSWETPLLYGAMMVWLLTPMVVWGLLRAPGAWLRQTALPWLVVVPLVHFRSAVAGQDDRPALGVFLRAAGVPGMYGRACARDETLQRTLPARCRDRCRACGIAILACGQSAGRALGLEGARANASTPASCRR
jgi:hypothetical protein